MIRALTIAALILLTACADDRVPAEPAGAERILGFKEAGGHYLLQQGDDIRIRLESNRSTGYRWTLLSESPGVGEVLSLVEEPDYRRSNAMPGAGGHEIWHFRATGIGPVKLYFTYGRPFETGTAPARQAIYSFEIR